MPFETESFDVVALAHSLRNFTSFNEIRSLFSEAIRILRKGGRIVVAESDTKRSELSPYNTFYELRTKLGWELELPRPSILVEWLSKSGFKKPAQRLLDTDFEYAPVYFPFDPRSMKDVEEQYRHAEKLLVENGEKHPPIYVITAER